MTTLTYTQLRFWWSSEPPGTSDPPPDQPPAPNADQSVNPQNLTQSQTSRPWFSWTAEALQSKSMSPAETELTKQMLEPKLEENTWLFGMFSKLEAPNPPQQDPKPPSEGWFWPFTASNPVDDSESDAEDESAEVFRAAKLAVETLKNQAHYAVKCKYLTKEVELAVLGTPTESLPVRFNYKRRPLTPHELLENSIFVKPKPRASESKLPEIKPAETASKADMVEASGSTSRPTSEQLAVPEPKAKSPSPSYPPSVLPHMDENFRVITLLTKLRLYGEAMVHGNRTSEKHLYRKTPSASGQKRKRIRKVVVISVHSFLPTKLVKSVVGQNTGNAVKFANRALEAMARWISKEEKDFEIVSIALEGQGPIGSRAENSFQLLKNWQHKITESDCILVVANSIASPVAVKLLSKMIEEFDLTKKKLGLLSMAGALCGPFPGLDTKVVIRAYSQMENEIIGELFEFQKKSALSTELDNCIKHLCEHNVKISMIGALSDQLVPLYSAVANHALHPNIYRAFFVDENGEIPRFVVKFFSLIMTMQNVGCFDQNLVRDLCERIQGSVSGGSHGRIFEHNEVYDIGVHFAMDTTSLVYNNEVKAERTTEVWQCDKNLFHVPWNVRGLINDLIHIKHIESLYLLKELVQEYKIWDPVTRPWKELKYCFAAFEEISIDELML